jgi:hypothetical protein
VICLVAFALFVASVVHWGAILNWTVDAAVAVEYLDGASTDVPRRLGRLEAHLGSGLDRDGRPYQELAAALRAKLWQHDIEAVGLALKGGLVTPDQALELLHDCDALHLVGTQPEPTS